MTVTTCKLCDRPLRCRGLCRRHYDQARRRGRFRLHDPAPVRRHLDALHAAGWTNPQISAATGIERANVQKIHRGRYPRIQRETMQLLLAVPIIMPPGPTRHGIDSIGARRRVHALAWMAWPAAEVAARAGTTVGSLQSTIVPGHRISVALHMRLAAVYDELSEIPGPSPRVAARARTRGFAPPAAWDDDTIDDPSASPSGVLLINDFPRGATA